jgi:hypothetical protein
MKIVLQKQIALHGKQIKTNLSRPDLAWPDEPFIQYMNVN